MIRRFRLIAGPNGSGKSTLRAWLARDYAVNFYHFINADDLHAEITRSGCCFVPFPVDTDELKVYAESSTYAEEIKDLFRNGSIRVAGDCIRFMPEAISTYSVALIAGFLQAGHLSRGLSFSQETVFSHSSKVEALKSAYESGYRTYLYFVATEDPRLNICRVADRVANGGHDVPHEKIVGRYARALSQIPKAYPYLSRAFFFDNSGDSMRYIAHWNPDEGLVLQLPEAQLPAWFAHAH